MPRLRTAAAAPAISVLAPGSRAGLPTSLRRCSARWAAPAAPRGAPRDLYIFVAISPHPIFQRDGPNIFCRVPIPFTTAALGGTIEVPTVEGSRTRVNVPAGTQSQHQFRLRGKGMTVLRAATRGD